MRLSYPELHTEQEEQEERQELQTLLKSGIFSKAPNLQHFLDFIAEKYFAGEADQVKEYSIAVHALNRPQTFDPQSDTIVRVTAHTLRKRLEQYYATQGLDHPVQIQLPAGKYQLRFIRKEATPAPPEPPLVPPQALEMLAPPVLDVAAVVPEADPAPGPFASSQPDSFLRDSALSQSSQSNRRRAWIFALVALGLLAAGLGSFQVKRSRARSSEGSASLLGSAAGRGAGGMDQTVRVLFSDRAAPYIDAAGRTWASNADCNGGSTFAHTEQDIRGTDDPTIFQEGREGRFHCRIAVPAGTYSLLLLFADTAGDKEAARQVVFTINNGAPQAVDIVDEAGANNTAVGKVYAGLHPMPDGFIHLDFISDGAFANAAELTPSSSDRGEPIRMLAGPAIFHDSQGRLWGPERFFVGGRRTFHPDNLPKNANARLFAWERYGHFYYSLPVVPGKEYTVLLYFSEGWFGTSNGGPGGPDSRVFDVYCNGTTLLKDFDILRDQKNGTVVMKSLHVKPTANGMLEIHFAPVKNYPLINAIEVEPES